MLWRPRGPGRRGLARAKRLGRRCSFLAFAAALAGLCLWSALRSPDYDDELSGAHGRQLADPPDAFTLEQRKHGALVLHIMGLLYMFVALAIVCDEFFVPSLEVIAETLELSPDVAGATFMAAGGSAPEFFTSMIGAVVLETDIGVGTIVGSAVFNVLFVIGACALVAPTALRLTWFPLARDSCFYIVDLFVLIAALVDSEVRWYEAVILFALYGFYITFMRYSAQLEGRLVTVVEETHADDVGAEPEQQCWAKSRAENGLSPVLPAVAAEDCQAVPCQHCSLQDSDLVQPGRIVDSLDLSCTSQLGWGGTESQLLDGSGKDGAKSPPRSASKRSTSRAGSKTSRCSSVSNLQAWREKEKERARNHSVSIGDASASGSSKRRSGVRDPHASAPGRSHSQGHLSLHCEVAEHDEGRPNTNVPTTNATGTLQKFAPYWSGQSVGQDDMSRATGGTGSEDSKAITERTVAEVPAPPRHGDPAPPTSTLPDLSLSGGEVATAGGPARLPNRDLTLASGVAETCCLSIIQDASESALDADKPGDSCSRQLSSTCDTAGEASKGDAGAAEGEAGAAAKLEEEDGQPIDLSPPGADAGWKDWVWYIGTLPIVALLAYTIPDIRREGWRKFYPLAFFLSICWIAGFTYWMVWFAVVLSETMGIEEHIMGLTVLASGTSVPDLITSVIVARQGQGDMAVSSSIGSNIFDVTVGLPVPWLVHSMIRQKPVTTTTAAPELGVLMLVLMLLLTIVTIMCNRWTMTKVMGVAMLVMYLIFEVASVLLVTLLSREEQEKLRIFSR